MNVLDCIHSSNFKTSETYANNGRNELEEKIAKLIVWRKKVWISTDTQNIHREVFEEDSLSGRNTFWGLGI